jgi:DNA polymerase-3 subunit beta
MKFTISQQSFAYGLQSVIKAIPSRPSHPILANVLLKAEGDRLILTAFDLNMGIEITLQDIEVESEGVFALPAVLLNNIISKLPQGNIVVSIADSTAIITTLSGEYQVQGISADEFPELPTIADDSGKLTLESAAIRQSLSGVLFSASSDETKVILCGVNIQLKKDGTLKLATTDGHRLSVSAIASTQLNSEIEITIPAKTLTEVLKNLKLLKVNDFDIEFDSLQVKFTIGDTIITSRVLDGQYPNYPQLLPSKFQRTLTCDRSQLLSSLERIGVLSDQRNNIVKFDLTSDKINLAVTAQDVGNGQETIDCEYTASDDSPFVIGFNIGYLSEALKAFNSETILFSINTNLSPVILKGDSEDFLHLIMPVQIRE